MTETFELASEPIKVYRSASHSDGMRHEIRRWWVSRPQRWVAWLMLNPSWASHDREDLTALRVTSFTKAWGYDGWIGVNVYPYISSKPADVWNWCLGWDTRQDWPVRDALQANLRDIARVGRESTLRIVAFGSEVVKRDEPWLEQCLEAYSQPHNGDSTLYCLGTSKSGHPLHPLARGRMRVSDSQTPLIWMRPCS